MDIRIRPTADVLPKANIGEATSVWYQANIRKGATIGEECILGNCMYGGADVSVGKRVKI